MTNSILTTILISLVSGLILILVGIVKWSVQRWVAHVDSLQASLDTLSKAVVDLRENFVKRTDHDRDIENLRVLALRAQCPHEDCKLKEVG